MNDSVEDVRCDKRGRVVTITLDRPRARNAIDPEMDHRLREIWTEFRDDDDADVAVLTGYALAGRIARHEQSAVRSAKETVLDVVGRPLDDQLEREALSAYSMERQRAQRIVDRLPLGSAAGGAANARSL